MAKSNCSQGLSRVRMLPDNVVVQRTNCRGIRVDGTYQGKFRCCLFPLVFEWRLQVMWNHYEVWTSEEWLRIKCPCGDSIFSFELTGV